MTTTDEARAALCPFCGGEARVQVEYEQTPFGMGNAPDRYMVGCWSNGCEVEPYVLRPTEAIAIAAWNTRAAPVVSTRAPLEVGNAIGGIATQTVHVAPMHGAAQSFGQFTVINPQPTPIAESAPEAGAPKEPCDAFTQAQWDAASDAFNKAVGLNQRGFSEWQWRMFDAMKTLGVLPRQANLEAIAEWAEPAAVVTTVGQFRGTFDSYARLSPGDKLYTHPAPAADVPGVWRPISEAPKDGTRFVGYAWFDGDHNTVIVSWDAKEELFTDGEGGCYGEDDDLTHWMPLPPRVGE